MNEIDVLFIHPGNRQQTHQSLGNDLCAIEPPALAGLFASYLRKQGKTVAIIDAPALNLSPAQVADLAATEYKPVLTVLVVYGQQPSASTQNMTAAGEICRELKAKAPSSTILMTGTHPAALPRKTMDEESVDFVCDREGPVTILKTVEALKAGRNTFLDVPSLWWRLNGEIQVPQSEEPLIRNLDEEMPGIAWDLLPMDRYRAHNWHCFDHIDKRMPYASIHTTLGCPYKCSFCCINAPFGKASYRMWSPESVIKEIDVLVNDYGVKNIKFIDEMFVLNRDHIMGICDLIIERGYDLNIWAYARVDSVKDEFLDKLKAAGVNWLCLGIESASEFVRDGAEKRYGNDDILNVVRRIQDAGIYIIGNYIFGLPDDTQASMRQTLDLANELNCEFSNFYCATAYPGSPLYDQAIEQGLELPEHWHDYAQHGYNFVPLRNEHVTAKEVLAFRDQAFTEHFTSERYLNMVAEKFGPEVVAHIKSFVDIPLKRKLLE